MGEPTKPTPDQVRIAKLEQLVADQARVIQQMQRVGGFADSKTIGIRCANIERRLDLLELDGDMLKDCQANTVSMFERHLVDRHAANIERMDGHDVAFWCRIRKRMREWADKRGLMTKRKDMTDTRRGENRVRPVTA